MNDKMIWMSASRDLGRHPKRSPLPAQGSYKRLPTSIGLGVPSVAGFVELDEEETVTYDARATPAVALPALLAKCEVAPQPNGLSTSASHATASAPHARGASFHTVPVFPTDADVELLPSASAHVESNIHRMDADRITDTLGPGTRVSEHHLRIGVSSYPPSSARPLTDARPRPSRRRSFFARFLFFVIVVSVLVLIAFELSRAGHMPWLDPRPHLLKAWKFVAQKIPWERLPKIPRL
jgi:hypothetical protein